MKQARGVALEKIFVHGQERPAFVFPESRAKQVLASLLSLCIVVASLLICVNANSWASSFPTHSPLMVRLGALFVALVFGTLGVMKFQQLRGRQGYLALVPQGIYRSCASQTYFVPWECIEEVAPFYVHATAFLGVRVQDAEKVECAHSLSKFMKSNRSAFGWDFAYGLRAFQVHPTFMVTAAQASLHFPQTRTGIGTAEGFLGVQHLVEQRWHPDPHAEEKSDVDLFSPQLHPELMNEELQRAIEAAAGDNTASNRRALYRVLLETTFCLPSGEGGQSTSGGESTSQFFLSQTVTGELALVAFSDPAALRRYDDNTGAMLVMPAAQLFALAMDNGCVQILINPAGPTGGKLDRSEFMLLAQGLMPN